MCKKLDRFCFFASRSVGRDVLLVLLLSFPPVPFHSVPSPIVYLFFPVLLCLPIVFVQFPPFVLPLSVRIFPFPISRERIFPTCVRRVRLACDDA